MKKIYILSAALLMVSIVSNKVMAQPPRGGNYGYNNNNNDNRNDSYRNNDNRYQQSQNAYFYYPSSNVYYNVNTRDYWYMDHQQWVRSNRLPKYMVLGNQARYDVRYDGRDGNVWKDNKKHYQKYQPVKQQPGVRVDIRTRH